MREIKFRAWWPDTKEMSEPFDLLDCDCGYIVGQGRSIPPPYDDTYVMQYTGLKDKNGKEIYEGDILRINTPNIDSSLIGYVHEVVKVDYELRTCLRTGLDLFHYIRFAESEVIGNIYENPELL